MAHTSNLRTQRRTRQEDCDVKTALCHIMVPCLFPCIHTNSRCSALSHQRKASRGHNEEPFHTLSGGSHYHHFTVTINHHELITEAAKNEEKL